MTSPGRTKLREKSLTRIKRAMRAYMRAKTDRRNPRGAIAYRRLPSGRVEVYDKASLTWLGMYSDSMWAHTAVDKAASVVRREFRERLIG